MIPRPSSASPAAATAAAGASRRPDPIPARAGIGLRHPHVPDFLGRSPAFDWPAIGWIEVHSENYLGQGGPRRAALDVIRQDFPLSCHGVGLSLGSAEGLDRDHLARLRALFDRVEPALVSEHVAWCSHRGAYLNDLLPLPYTEEALAVVCRNVDHAQSAFGRRILVENPSSYVRYAASVIPEQEFMGEIARRTGCGILLDVNNIHVSAHNHRFDAERYLDAIPAEAVQEIHIAGHYVHRLEEGQVLLIDDHGAAVADPVWALLCETLDRFGPRPILVEWDTSLPPLATLLAEAAKAGRLLDAAQRRWSRAHAA